MVLQLLTALKKERLHESAASQIKGLIASGRLEVGQRLATERELARRLGVSRVVVREALRSLEHSGLIEVRPGAAGGAFITRDLHKPLSNAARDLMNEGKLTARYFFEARRAIECSTIALAATRAKTEDIEKLRAINRSLLRDRQENTKLREHNAAFHIAIANISGNPLMKLLVQSLMELLNTVFPRSAQTAAFVQNTVERHEAIIAALVKRDVALCQELMARDTEFTVKLKRVWHGSADGPRPSRGRGRAGGR
ncbi:MAG: FadR/GntR family transcriptional regulator [bacterium]